MVFFWTMSVPSECLGYKIALLGALLGFSRDLGHLGAQLGWSDVILSAWWMSGEYGGNVDEYKSVIDGYNAGLKDKSLTLALEKAKAMNPYLDILWYLNILWVRKLMGDDSQTERRKGMVLKILNETK